MTQPPDPTRRDPAPTRRDESPAPTRRDAPPGAPADHPTPLLRLPESLARRYRLVRQLPTQGAEADLLLIEPAAGADPVVCKLYRPGLRPNTEVLSRISANHPQTVVRLLEHGETEGISYEIMEWAEHGSLRALLDQGAFSPARVGQLLNELHAALGELHAQHILHRDLKPENLLVRCIDPLRIALTDFGIASVSDTTLHFTSVHRTVRYAAPEAAAGVVSPASDYWSVGMILAEALTGRHPFAGLSERVVALRLSTHPVPLEDLDEPWLTLCRGLLVRDPAHRWGKDEIDRWLAQDRTLSVPAETETPHVAGALRAGRPYRIAGNDCWTGKDLAAQLAQHWTDGVKGLQRNLIAPWLRDELHDQDSVLLVMDLLEDPLMTPDQRLLRLILHLAPEQAPVWKGMSLAVSDLTALARRALQGEAASRDALAEIWDRGILPTVAQAGHTTLGELHNRWSEAVTSYRQGWEKVIAGGAPARAKPDLRTALPALLLTVSDRDFVRALRDQAEREIPADAMACSWYRALAALDPGVPAEALILGNLLPSAAQTGKAERLRAEKNARLNAAENERRRQIARRLARRNRIRVVSILLSVFVSMLGIGVTVWMGMPKYMKEPIDSPEMVFVKGGSFQMGSPTAVSDRSYDERQHPVTVTDFFMGKHEVTQAQWQALMGNNPSIFSRWLYGCDDCPVEQVSWTDVQDYLSKLNKQTGKGYRLPTEAEWEYACHSGGKADLACGDSIEPLALRSAASDSRTHPVGSKAANALGLFDMNGNVLEWTSSLVKPRYCSGQDADLCGAGLCYSPSGRYFAIRGGSWDAPSRSSANHRRVAAPDYHCYNLGFRLAHD